MKSCSMMIAIAITACFISCKKDVITTPVEVATVTPEASALTSYPVQREVYTSIDANIGGYLEALPVSYASSTTKRFPLIIFLHGAGEKGNGTTQLYLVKKHSVAKLLDQHLFPATFTVNSVSYSFIVISPQFKTSQSVANVTDVINYAIKKYRVDTSRIYLTGLSLGGGTVWNYAAAYPKRIAAITPMSAASYPTVQKATAIATGNVPVWAFHNNGDQIVSVSWTNNWITYINNVLPLIKARKTIFTSTKHNSWATASDPNYKENNMNIYQWMLQYKKKTY